MSDERRQLIDHLVGPGHDVMAYGPTSDPNDLDVAALTAWHQASHEGDNGNENATCSEDGHSHEQDVVLPSEEGYEDAFDVCPEPTCPLYGKAVMADHRHLS